MFFRIEWGKILPILSILQSILQSIEEKDIVA